MPGRLRPALPHLRSPSDVCSCFHCGGTKSLQPHPSSSSLSLHSFINPVSFFFTRLPSLGSGRPVAFSSLFGAAFLFPASNPPKMLSLSPSADYKQTLTSCFSGPWRRQKAPTSLFTLLPKTIKSLGFFFFSNFTGFVPSAHSFNCPPLAC